MHKLPHQAPQVPLKPVAVQQQNRANTLKKMVHLISVTRKTKLQKPQQELKRQPLKLLLRHPALLPASSFSFVFKRKALPNCNAFFYLYPYSNREGWVSFPLVLGLLFGFAALGAFTTGIILWAAFICSTGDSPMSSKSSTPFSASASSNFKSPA